MDFFRILCYNSIQYEPNNPENQLPYARTWFRFSLTNLRHRASEINTLSHDDIIFIYLLSYHFRINLPKTIFNHLKYSIEISRTHVHSYIPYGRILSKIMFRRRIREIVKSIEPEHVMFKTICDRVDEVKDFDD